MAAQLKGIQSIKPITPVIGQATRCDGETVRYVEDKPLKMDAVGELLAISKQENHWTNFGPVSQMLEGEIARALNLADHLRVVVCASATAAMHGMVAMHETLAGRKLRWATSSFGYYSAVQGPLKTAKIVDCDERGMLDLETLDLKSTDAFVVTNTFGQQQDLERYRRFASTNGKLMMVDAALAFGSHDHQANECISFHHTKPWGFGEGGCAIVDQAHEELFRSMICFGHEPGEAINRNASNGKMSDIASAFALVRLREMKSVKAQYSFQYERIAEIALEMGAQILGDVHKHPGTPSNVPVLLPKPFADFTHSQIPTGRYYHPLSDTKNANDIYSRIVNIPCHGDMQAFSSKEIASAIKNFLRRAK